ncbi:MAG TPA: YraN family protein [Candidatus Limnocylindria bacterium]|nr:YraN family protein [Candidatus Limnocylindria bacterium]
MGDPRHELGQRAEEVTDAWLTQHGWRVLARRLRSAGGGEVDLVALDPSGCLVAVEVRARSSARTGSAATSVDRRRVARLARTLAAFATSGTAPPHRGLRVDLVTAEPIPDDPTGGWRLRRLPGIGW